MYKTEVAGETNYNGIISKITVDKLELDKLGVTAP